MNLYSVWMRVKETNKEIMLEVYAPDEYAAKETVKKRADITGYDDKKHEILKVEFMKDTGYRY